MAHREVRRQAGRVHLRADRPGRERGRETWGDPVRHEGRRPRPSRRGVQLRRVRPQVQARRGSRDGLHGESHPWRGYLGQDDHPGVGRRRGDPRWPSSPAPPRRPEAAAGVAARARRALRLLPGEGGDQARLSLRAVGFIALPGGQGTGFDHADTYLDPAGSRLYVAHTAQNTVDVIDCRTDSYLRSLPDLPGVAGVLVDTERDLLITSDRAAARVSIFRCSDEKLLAQVEVGPRPNGLAFDPGRGHVFSFNLGEPPGTSCTASVISIGERRVVRTIELPGRPRWAVFDAATDRVWANIQRPAVIVRIDAAALREAAPVGVGGDGPHGLAVIGDRLFFAADGGELLVIQRGAGTKRLPLPGVPARVMHAEGPG